jgi:hypothetical protein
MRCTGLRVETHVIFVCVPAFPQHPKRRLRGLYPGCVPRLDIGFQGGHDPVICLAPRAEMPCQRPGLILSRVQREPNRLHTPALRDVKLHHQGAPRSPVAATAASACLAAVPARRRATQTRTDRGPDLGPMQTLPCALVGQPRRSARSYFCSYSTPPTTTDQSTRNSWQRPGFTRLKLGGVGPTAFR